MIASCSVSRALHALLVFSFITFCFRLFSLLIIPEIFPRVLLVTGLTSLQSLHRLYSSTAFVGFGDFFRDFPSFPGLVYALTGLISCELLLHFQKRWFPQFFWHDPFYWLTSFPSSYLTNEETWAVYYTVIKHDGHLRTRISRVFSNVRSVLSKCNTRLRLLHLLYDIDFTRAKQ